MDDLSRIATVTAIAVAVGATIGGMKGWDVGSSAAEKRIEESPLKRELLERRAAAEEEIETHRHSATADCERTLRKLESDFTAWRNLEETRLSQRRLAGESELSSLKRKRDNLRVWTTASDDSTDRNSVTESDVRTVRDRFKKWLLEERAEEAAVIDENETIASKCAEVLAKMERTATAKGTKAKDESGWTEVKNRMETADATIRKKREKLEEEFIKLETGKCLDQAKGLLEGTDDEPGIAARLKALRENAEDLLAELDRHLKTDEERAAEHDGKSDRCRFLCRRENDGGRFVSRRKNRSGDFHRVLVGENFHDGIARKKRTGEGRPCGQCNHGRRRSNRRRGKGVTPCPA